MSVNIDDIKRAYPNPSTDQQIDDPDCYCVGGAILLYEGYGDASDTWAVNPRFPDDCYLADVLRELNPGLTAQLAMRLAEGITRKNDRGHFDDAWSIAALALRHKFPTP